jgi:predicted amidohydrolase
MKNLKIAAVQTHPVFGRVEENLAAALDLLPPDCDLAVLPELFSTGYQFASRDEAWDLAEDLVSDPAPGTVCAGLTEAAAVNGITIVAGLAEKAGDRLFNSSVLIRPDGTRGLYRKVHLFLDEKSIFTPGDLGFPVFEACGTTVGMMVCFDWIFPESARSLALGGAEVLCHPSNLVLPWCQAAMVTRCQENMVAAVTANRVGTENRTGSELTFRGRSQVLSRMGERLAGLDEKETGVAMAEVEIITGDKLFTPRNDLWTDRRPEAYRTEPSDS